MVELTPRQRAYLKGLAHHLKPVVHIGKDGISDAVRVQIDEALAHHELIKVKLGENAPLDRDEATAALPAAVGAQLVQNLGRQFVLYRAHPDEPTIVLPQGAAADE
jgi:RNA-binding protein